METKRLEVTAEGKKVYDIVIENNFNQLVKELSVFGIKERKLCIVTERQVASYYLEEVCSLLEKECAKLEVYIFQEGEESKNLSTVDSLYHFLITHEFDRKDMLLALGGGVTGDLTGFAAATYLRGIDFVQIPTSLLAQVDSSIGGKTGVDFLQYKNMVGAFHQPRLVYMNVHTLDTLSDELFSCGMGEVLKHGLIRDLDYFEWLKENREKVLNLDEDALTEMIYKSCVIKKTVVENDPTEKGERAVLNMGHTVGHAVEKLKNFKLLHGQCVSIGTVCACYLSLKRGLITKEEYESALEALRAYRLPISVQGLNAAEILTATKSDKKMEQGKIKFVLLEKMGYAYIDKTVTDEEMKEAIEVVLEESGEEKS